MRILMVENEASLAAYWAEHLRKRANEVNVVASGEAALAAARESSVDLVLMDIELDGAMDGVEAAGRLRSVSDAPLVFMTAHSEGEAFERAQLAHPAGYLRKPFSLDMLSEAVTAIQNATDRMTSSASPDHDLLVTLNVKLDFISSGLTEARVEMKTKANAVEVEARLIKIESDVASNMKIAWMIMGGLAVLQALLRFVPAFKA
jgi:DNA-binding response OmpR family regulator